MNEENSITVSAATVEEAIEKGLAKLGLVRTQVDIEIIDEGSKGLFGIGAKKAQIMIAPAASVFDLVENQHLGKEGIVTEAKADEQPNKINSGKTDHQNSISQNNDKFDEEDDSQPDEQTEELARHTVEDLLDQMGVQASISTKIETPQGEEKPVVAINIEGDDLSYLIGRRSETLNAIQYIACLIASKKKGSWVQIQLDVQNYRARRVAELQKIARRTADQVASTGRRMYLEPMPANERRIVHMELRKNNKVRSESIGEDPNRKVGISPN